ncbi:MAG: GNAT family N-acetyltransferase [Terriglobales bacterium]
MTAWQVHERHDLRALREVWTAAAAAASEDHIFQRWELAQIWMTVFGQAWDCRILWRAFPPLVLPLVVDGEGNWSLLGNGLFDFCDGLGVPEDADVAELRQACYGGHGGRAVAWDQFRVTGIRDDSRFLDLWRALGLRVESYAGAPRVPAQDAAAWILRHPRLSDRFEAARRQGWRLERLDDPRARMQLLHRILAWKESRLHDLGQDNVLGGREQAWLQHMVARYPELAELWAWGRGAEWQAGFLCWNESGAPAASAAAPGWRRGYTLAFAPEAADRSPGSLLLFGVMRHSLVAGRGFDLLTGEQEFKRRLATARVGLQCIRGQNGAEQSEC